MPLFGSHRDAKLVKHISKELLHRIVSIEVVLYKLALPEMEINLYNESAQKVYFQPVKLFALIMKDDTTFNDVDTGMDKSQTIQFKFLRDDLRENNVFVDVGDIIKFDEKYYEADNLKSQQYWIGRNNETLLNNTENINGEQHGYNVSIVVETHLTRLSQLNLVEVRSGINKPKSLPKNL